MNRFWRNKPFVIVLSVTVAIAVVIGVFSALTARDRATFMETAAETALKPGQKAITGIGSWIRSFGVYFSSVKALREENDALKQENVRLDKQVRDAEGLEWENEQLRAMLKLQKTDTELQLQAAQIVSKDPANWYCSFRIDKGTNDGVEKGKPVLTEEKALVGQVYKVGPNWAEVITVLDPESGVGTLIERSRELGVTEGDFTLRMQGLCRLGYLSRDTDIKEGDYVETSGMGGVFPKGLLVGKVEGIKDEPETMSKYALVRPMVDFSRLSHVFVLKNSVETVHRTEITTTAEKLLGEQGADGSGIRNMGEEDEDE